MAAIGCSQALETRCGCTESSVQLAGGPPIERAQESSLRPSAGGAQVDELFRRKQAFFRSESVTDEACRWVKRPCGASLGELR